MLNNNLTKLYLRTSATLRWTSNILCFRATSLRFSSTNQLDNIANTFSRLLGNNYVSMSKVVCEQHSHDESYHHHHIPQVVVWPNTVEEVAAIAKVCFDQKICMIPFGTGTGLEGGVVPMKFPTVSVNLTNLNEISHLNIDDFDVKVRPGVTRKQLNHELRSTGLWFPVDPGADASLCGMAATGASGTNAVRYGTMKQNVLNLEVVLADGTVLNTGGVNRHCRKSSAGYNLTELFVGSEGTLGFITSVTLKLHGVPEKSLSAVCSFPTILDAVNTSVQVLQSNIPIARMELLDKASIKAINKYSDMSNPVQPTIFFEFHGTENSAQEQVEGTAEIADFNSGSEFKWASTQEEVNHLWQARHNVLYAVHAMSPGSTIYSTDVCVPVSQLPEAIEHSVSVLDDVGLNYGVLGHVGDGNFHCILTFSENDVLLVKDVAKSIGMKAISLGGTCTGEHGIGLGKKDLLKEEMGATGISAMNLIKKAFDPLNLMNPEKML